MRGGWASGGVGAGGFIIDTGFERAERFWEGKENEAADADNSNCKEYRYPDVAVHEKRANGRSNDIARIRSSLENEEYVGSVEEMTY